MAQEATILEQLKRHRAWWQGQGMLLARIPHKGLSDLWLPLADGSLAQNDLELVPDMLDLERLAGPQQMAGPLALVDDVFETAAPYERVPWLEAILGCRILATIQGGSMRGLQIINAWEQWPQADRSLGEAWRETLLQLVEMMVQRSAGRSAVTQTLMRGPSDLAEAALGPELTCLSIFDSPQALDRFLAEAAALFVSVLYDQLERIPRIEGGMVNSFGIWAPGTVARSQCDASAFLSPQQYARSFWPHNATVCESVDYAVIHLHSGSLHVLDPILAADKPQAIQVSIDPEPSGPALPELVPAFRRILDAKALIVDGPMSEQDVELLLSRLPHRGLCILARQGTW